MNYCCVCGCRADHPTKSFHCVVGDNIYHYCHLHSLIGKKVFDKCYKTPKRKVKVYKTQNKNPYPKYSYNSGLIMEDGTPVWGIDTKWSLFEIKQGRLPPLDRIEIK